jgi:predicted nucleotidyltransferase
MAKNVEPMELSEDRLVVSKGLSNLDRDVAEFVDVLEECGVSYVIVSGYVAILTGRSRSTEDVDVIIEPLSEFETEQLVDALKNCGYWGMAMPLDSMHEMLSEGDRIRIAEEDEMIPNFEVWFADSSLERDVLADPLVAEVGDETVNISPIERQIAYKLHLAQSADSLTGKDFEDALHLYTTFTEQLNTEELQRHVEEHGVERYYDEL